jgi:NADPH:quinone reductase-like Zn-dependent oxidoreductase
MKAFIVDRYRSKDGGRIAEMSQPELRDADVLVQIHAAGVNPLDSRIRDGEFKLLLPYRFPLILGNEAAGVVIRVGSSVRRFKVGDEVYARPNKDRIGTFAEFISMNEGDVAIKPKELTMEEAATIPCPVQIQSPRSRLAVGSSPCRGATSYIDNYLYRL